MRVFVEEIGRVGVEEFSRVWRAEYEIDNIDPILRGDVQYLWCQPSQSGTADRRELAIMGVRLLAIDIATNKQGAMAWLIDVMLDELRNEFEELRGSQNCTKYEAWAKERGVWP